MTTLLHISASPRGGASEVILLDTGHFALEEEADTIATTVTAFLSKHLD
jgi:hypothetical protein